MRIFIIPVLVFLFVSCEKKKEAVEQKPMPVTVANPAKRAVIVYNEFPATIEGLQEVEIRARVPGILSLASNVPDFAGKRIEKGVQLFVIEPEPYEQETLAAEAAVNSAIAARNLAQKRFERIERAGRTNAVSKIDVEVAAAELAEAEAAIAGAKATLEGTKINQTYTKISSPLSGRMSRLMVDPGNLVGSSEKTLLATIIDDAQVYVYFEVPERSVLRFLQLRDKDEAQKVYEQELRLKLANGAVYPQTGRIDYIENEIDPGTRTVNVRAIFPNPDGALSSGLYGLVGYPGSPNPEKPDEKEALLVPSAAVLRDLAGNFVWVVDEKNTVRRKPVIKGETVEKPKEQAEAPRVLETIILSGLTGDERVIVAGLQRARDGAVVLPMTEEEVKQAQMKQAQKLKAEKSPKE